MAKKVGILGAGGKMGCRIMDNLKGNATYQVLPVEVDSDRWPVIADRGFRQISLDDMLQEADFIVLAIPDRLIGKVTKQLIPRMRPGTTVVSLDPAAAYANVIPVRGDLNYFVCHPCHPPIFHGELSDEAQTDWFGGKAARQSVVCALHHGAEEAYAEGEHLAAAMFKPILRMHRITVEQMAILEPAVVETTTSSFILACKEAMDLAISLGIPEQAAKDFVLGHIQIQLAVIFGYADFPFSDGAKLAIKNAQTKLLKEDWKKEITDLNRVRASVAAIVEASEAQ